MTGVLNYFPPLSEGQLHDASVELAQILEFCLGGIVRDDRCGRGADVLRHPRHRDGAVSRAGGIDSASQLGSRATQHRITDGPHLERAHRLQVFKLQMNRACRAAPPGKGRSACELPLPPVARAPSRFHPVAPVQTWSGVPCAHALDWPHSDWTEVLRLMAPDFAALRREFPVLDPQDLSEQRLILRARQQRARRIRRLHGRPPRRSARTGTSG